MAGVLNSDWELAAWFYDYDGIELINEAYEEWGLYFLPPNISIYPLEPMMSTVSLAKLDDFEGVMIRSFPGPSGDMLTALGATVTPIAGAEIYTALETGVVDAAEYTGFMENWDAGLHEVSKYALYPSPHVLASIRDITITLDSWNALSPDLQAALEMACNDFTARDYFTEKGTQEIGRKMMEDYGIIIQSLSDEDWATCMQIGKQLAEEYKQKTATANKVITSQIEAAKALGTW